MGFGIILIAGIAVLAAIYFARHEDPARRARLLRSIGFGLTAASTVFFGAFMVGEPLADPGGWRAAVIIAAWAAPLSALCALAWYRPAWAVPVLAAGAAVAVGIGIWFATDSGGWAAFEDRNGPIRDVIAFVLVGAMALLGLRRPAAAGTLLLVTGVLPPVISGLGSAHGLTSLAVVSSAPVVPGVLYLLSARIQAQVAGDRARARARAGSD